MSGALALVTLVVPDYDAAIRHYCDGLGFALAEDRALGGGKRWVVVQPGATGAALLLARADGAAQAARVGDQTGGRVAFFLEVPDFDAAAERIAPHVTFEEAPRDEDYGRVAVFRDAFGNRWDLIERR
ncbi:MAG: VOC family protein [Pseudomonadota bacterium]